MKNQLPELILIAGLNNNDEAMKVLATEFRAAGFICHLMNIPGQGADRSESESFERAEKVFARNLETILPQHYAVVAFSTSALYFNLWLQKNPLKKPSCQLLLSPAIVLRNSKILSKIFHTLPGKLAIRSLAPPKFRRFNWVRMSEYRQLFLLVSAYEKLARPITTPFKILIDPRDELVNAQALKKIWPQEVQLIKRTTHKIAPGMFHAIFHPDFWQEDEWKKFIADNISFLKQS